MSLVSVALGGLIAWQDGKVSLAALLLTALGATLVHGATNAVNDFLTPAMAWTHLRPRRQGTGPTPSSRAF